MNGMFHSSPQLMFADGADNRSVYLGGVEPSVGAQELLDHVHCGLIDSIKIFPDKGCAFISFVDPSAAQIFHREVATGKVTLRDKELKAGWGRVKPLPPDIILALEHGVTRNVFIGGIDPSMDSNFFRQEFSRFGDVEHVKVLPEKKVAFVHFTSLNSALKCVNSIQKEPSYSRFKINYGKDRCNKRSENLGFFGGGASGSGVPITPIGHSIHVKLPNVNNLNSMNQFNSTMNQQNQINQINQGFNDSQRGRGMQAAPTLRTVYLGGIDANTTAEELCEHIKGGLLDNIKVIPEKNCAFVTFIYSEGAQNFYDYASQGLLIKGRPIKVGWGKATSLPFDIAYAVSRGATRNVYIGNIDENINEQKIREDFGNFGQIEVISFVQEKKCAFVSFTSTLAAIRAVEDFQTNVQYQNYRVNFGKDLCARIPPRTGRVMNMNMNSSSSINSTQNSKFNVIQPFRPYQGDNQFSQFTQFSQFSPYSQFP